MNFKKQIWSGLWIALAFFILLGCQNEEEGNSQERETATLNIWISMPLEKSNPFSSLATALGTSSDVTQIKIDVKEGNTTHIQGQDLTKSGELGRVL